MIRAPAAPARGRRAAAPSCRWGTPTRSRPWRRRRRAPVDPGSRPRRRDPGRSPRRRGRGRSRSELGPHGVRRRAGPRRPRPPHPSAAPGRQPGHRGQDSVHKATVAPPPPRLEVRAGRAFVRRQRSASEAALHVPGHRLDHGAAPCRPGRGRATARRRAPGLCRATTVPGHRRTRAAPPRLGAGRAGAGVVHQGVGVDAGQVAPASPTRDARRRQAAFEQPAAGAPPGDDQRLGHGVDECRRTGTDTLAVVPHDTMGRRGDAPGPEHLAGAVAGADHDRDPGAAARARRPGSREGHRPLRPTPGSGSRSATSAGSCSSHRPTPDGVTFRCPRRRVRTVRRGPRPTPWCGRSRPSPVRRQASGPAGRAATRAWRAGRARGARARRSWRPPNRRRAPRPCGVDGASPSVAAALRASAAASASGAAVRPQQGRPQGGRRRRPPGRRSGGRRRTRSRVDGAAGVHRPVARRRRTAAHAATTDRHHVVGVLLGAVPAAVVRIRAWACPTATGPSFAPQHDLGDTRAEVDGEDHAGTAPPAWRAESSPCTVPATIAAVSAGSGSWYTTRPMASPAPPPAMTSRTSSSIAPGSRHRGAARRGRAPATPRWPPHGPRRRSAPAPVPRRGRAP